MDESKLFEQWTEKCRAKNTALEVYNRAHNEYALACRDAELAWRAYIARIGATADQSNGGDKP